MIHIREVQGNKDIEGILALQKKHLMAPDNQSQDWSDGFVTLQHTPEILRAMMAESPQIVAVDETDIVGYNLSMNPHRAKSFPVLKPMLANFEKVYIGGIALSQYPYMIGGQCCIDAAYRGRGLLGSLYRGTKRKIESSCDFIVTEIARSNPRSLHAHLKIGFEVVHEYATEHQVWDIVLWDWSS